MFKTAFLLFVAAGLAGVGAQEDKPLVSSATGTDGRIEVTVSVTRDTVPPGEDQPIDVSSKMLFEGPLKFPANYSQPLTHLYLRMPNGRVIIYPEKGTSPKSHRPLEASDYGWGAQVSVKGQAGPYTDFTFPLVDPSPDWFEPETYEPVRPNLRAEGIYEAWAVYTIPKVAGAPADAWQGKIETDRVRFLVKEIPVKARRAEPTREQIEHLEAYIKYDAARRSGQATPPPKPERVEMPEHMTLDDRLRWALGRTENEGFARHVVTFLRDHRPKDENEEYPQWWSNVRFFILQRAYFDRPGDETSLRIHGPYLDEFAEIAMDETECQMVGRKRSFSGDHSYIGLLLDYVEYKPESSIRRRLETLARQYAKLPAGAARGNRELRGKLETSWCILFTLGVFRDGMHFAEAKEILGEPTTRTGGLVSWDYDTGARVVDFSVEGRVIGEKGEETIEFVQRKIWDQRKPR